MKNIHNWEIFNELYRGTYFHAASKLDKSQPLLAKKLRDHGSKFGLYKIPFIKDYKFDVYVNFTFNEIKDEFYPRKVVRNLKFGDYLHLHQNHEMELIFEDGYTEDTKDYFVSAIILLNDPDENDRVKIRLFDDSNKFANKKSAKNFIEVLHKLYIFHNPNNTIKALSKISDSEINEIKPEETSDENFWGFLHKNGFNWDTFIKEINIRDLWDSYE